MATHEIDQKIIGRLAKEVSQSNLILASTLFKIAGLSFLLGRQLVRARRLRKLDTSRDTKSLALYQRIIWLAREGLSMTETYILTYVEEEHTSVELRVFALKLRASFFHVFCLFQNHPPVSQLSPTPYASPELAKLVTPPLGVSLDTGLLRTRTSPTKAGNGTSSRGADNGRVSRSARERRAALRDTIPSITSEASYITNPYAAVTPPPGIPPRIPNPSGFLLPVMNFIPLTSAHFNSASSLAATMLPGSAPLRLSVVLEHCAFLWDCLHDHEGSRRMARQTISEVYRAQEGMDDDEFEDAALLVGTLGRMMRRKSLDATPRVGESTPRSAGVHDPSFISPIQELAPPMPLRKEELRQNSRDAVDNTTGVLPVSTRSGRLAPATMPSSAATSVVASGRILDRPRPRT